MRPKAWTVLVASAVALSALGAPPLLAQDETDGRGWDHSFTLYLMGAGLSGTSTIRGIEQDIDLSFGDIWSNLDLGGMLLYRAESDRWLAQVDVQYVRLKPTVDRPPATIDFEQTIAEFIGGYKASEEVEILFGARWVDLAGGFTGEGPGMVKIDGGIDWVDPFIGGAWTRRFDNGMMVRLRGDIGGFSLGSNFAWQLVALGGWDFAQRWSLLFGYRHLDMKYEEGSGRQAFVYDVATSGPMAGVSVRF